MSNHAYLIDMLSNTVRLFPNTMMITLFVVGIATSKISWILAAIGGILVTIATIAIQHLFGKIFTEEFPGEDVIEACSIIPTLEEYSYTPSLWVALTTYFLIFIARNAYNIYTAPPGHGSKKDAIAVQQRKGTGLISMFITSALLFLFITVRWFTTCERISGVILGVLLGGCAGYYWWKVVSLCSAQVYPDIHGIMAGLGIANLQLDRITVCLQ